MMICCPCCGVGIEAEADAELALDAAISERNAAIARADRAEAELRALKERRCGTCGRYDDMMPMCERKDRVAVKPHDVAFLQVPADWHCADWTPKGGE